MVAGEVPAGVGHLAVVPDDLVPVLILPEHAVHGDLQVVARRGVAVEVDGARVAQEPPHLQQPDGHHDQVRLHGGAVGLARRVDYGTEGGLTLRDLAMPVRVQVGRRPGVLERGALGVRACGSGVGPVGVERGIEVDEVDAAGVHAPHDVEVVARPQGAVGPVRLAGGRSRQALIRR